MKKRLLGLIALTSLCTCMFAGCQQTQPETNPITESETTVVETPSTEPSAIVQDVASEEELTVATTAGVHADILNRAADELKNDGITLKVLVYNDYYMPNLLVDNGDVDANYFQHAVYLNDFNKKLDTNLVSVGTVHFEPLGIYPGQKSNIEDLEKGDVIVIPSDTTNKTRALRLLQNVGIIALDSTKSELTLSDIQENPYDVSIELEDASVVPSRVKDSALIVLNGNYARDNFLSVTEDAIAYENVDMPECEAYWNILAVKEENKGDPKIQKLIKILQSNEMKDFIDSSYGGTAIAK